MQHPNCGSLFFGTPSFNLNVGFVHCAMLRGFRKSDGGSRSELLRSSETRRVVRGKEILALRRGRSEAIDWRRPRQLRTAPGREKAPPIPRTENTGKPQITLKKIKSKRRKTDSSRESSRTTETMFTRSRISHLYLPHRTSGPVVLLENWQH